MSEWRVIIADDEPVARRGVRQLLAPYPAFRVVAECRDGHEVERELRGGLVDVVILDIEMPGMDGLEVARRWSSERGPALVFLTAHSTHALAAFESAAVDYLVKPVSAARFARTIKRLGARLGDRQAGRSEPTLLVSAGRTTMVLQLREVDWIAAADHYARVWSGGRSYLLREPLDALEIRLGQHGFLRTHRNALVRVAVVRAVRRSSNGTAQVVLESGARVPVARRRIASLAPFLAFPNSRG